jgi:hypothetical protein
VSEKKRFLFDECIGRPVMTHLHQLVSTTAVFFHICDYFHDGIKDPVWVPRLQKEGGWVVITTDGGKNSKRREKLPDLCRAYRVSHLVMSKTLHTQSSFQKAAALAQMWPSIELLHDEPKGTRWNLKYKTGKGGTLILKLDKITFEPGE